MNLVIANEDLTGTAEQNARTLVILRDQAMAMARHCVENHKEILANPKSVSKALKDSNNEDHDCMVKFALASLAYFGCYSEVIANQHCHELAVASEKN